MTDQVFNIAKGAAVQKVRGGASALLLLLLKANETEDDFIDHEDVAALLGAAGNTEADFTNYGRKTGLTATETLDHVNNRSELDLPDQTYTAAGGASNNTLTKAVVAYEDSASDAGRVPQVGLDAALVTDGNDFNVVFNGNGYFRAS